MNNLSKNFFLISFLPALAYWYLEAYYPIKVAVTGGIILSIVEISLEKFFTKEIHTISKFNFFLIVVLGALSFFDNKGIWFKLVPGITALAIALFFIYQNKKGKGVMGDMMVEMLKGKNHPLIQIIGLNGLKGWFQKMERDMGYLCLFYGIFMIVIALWGSSDQWIFFKTIGFYIVFILFMIAEFILFRNKLKRQQEKFLLNQYLRQQQMRKRMEER
ncbi:MAG: septation protein IspZ [Oligoflexia bacterium]|nr:septation protein IspZ [Oligoflexia bacterium]